MMHSQNIEIVIFKRLIRNRRCHRIKRADQRGRQWSQINDRIDRFSSVPGGMLKALRLENWVLGFSKARLCPAG